jgi:hypothetical protein
VMDVENSGFMRKHLLRQSIASHLGRIFGILSRLTLAEILEYLILEPHVDFGFDYSV